MTLAYIFPLDKCFRPQNPALGPRSVRATITTAPMMILSIALRWPFKRWEKVPGKPSGALAKKDFTSAAPQACVDMRFVYTGEENGITRFKYSFP